MNVTIKLPDNLCREARHRAVDESKSLSGWLSDLVRRELAKSGTDRESPRTWLDAFSDDHPQWFYERELPLPDRKAEGVRDFSFEEES